MSLFDPSPRGRPLFVLADAEGRLPFRPASFQTIVTSPPYWKARDYGHGVDQLGNEDRVVDFVARLVRIFDGLRPMLRGDGTLWVNLGDTFNTRSMMRAGPHNRGLGHSAAQVGASAEMTWAQASAAGLVRHSARAGSHLKDKDLPLVPHRFAIAMIDAGWYLRADVVWAKDWGKPENATDRPTRAHESVFMFTKRDRYKYHQYDQDRDVWRIPPATSGDGPAVFPDELAARCIRASSSVGDVVFDPFVGSGTTTRVADQLGRVGVGADLTSRWLC